MIIIDKNNAIQVGLDLYPVAQKHQQSLISVIEQEQIPSWKDLPYFLSASIHKSIDGQRVFVYSQWNSRFDYRILPKSLSFCEYYQPESLLLEVVTGRPMDKEAEIKVGGYVVHLAEFRTLPVNQTKLIDLAKVEVDNAGVGKNGLISATFHRSLEGTRVFNYGHWENKEAIEILAQKPRFNSNEHPYWEGLAKNEYHLYEVVSQFSK